MDTVNTFSVINIVVVVTILSVIVQFAAAIVAVKLIRIAGSPWAWICIAIAIFLMSIRRIDTLYFILTQEKFLNVLYYNEFLGAILSVFMLVGLIGIIPIFSRLRKEFYSKLLDEKLISESVVNTAVAGILVVDLNNKVLLHNQRFADIWKIPKEAIDTLDDREYLKHAQELLVDPQKFVREVQDLYINKDSKSQDEVHLKDGRILDRYSSPLYDSNKKYRGRVWFFRDITIERQKELAVENEKLVVQAIINTAVAGILVTDIKGKVLLFNKRFPEIWHIPQDILDTWDDATYLDHATKIMVDPQKFVQVVKGLYYTPDSRSQDEVKLKNGGVIDCYSSPLYDANKSYRGRVWFFRDISDIRHKEEELRREVDFEKVIGQIVKRLVEYNAADLNGGIEETLSKIGSFIGFDRANIFLISEDKKTKNCIYEWTKEGIKPLFQHPKEYPNSFFQTLEKTLERDRVLYIKDVSTLGSEWEMEKKIWAQGGVKSNICIALSTRDKYLGYACFEYIDDVERKQKQLYKESNINLLKALGEVVAVVLERRKIEEQLENVAKFDSLTTLPNRYQFSTTVDRMLSYSIRNNLVLAVLSMDIDNFKNVNDTYGHGVGDLLLKEVGERCRANVRAEDFIARMGGDEFVIVIFGLKDESEAKSVAKKMLEVVSQGYKLEGHTINVTISIGIACCPIDGKDKETLLKNADIAMYKAKAAGKNNYQYFTKDLERVRKGQLDLENEMQIALDKNEFFLVYQPQFDENKKMIGMEALLRWQHPTKGLLLPGNYITIAEDNGFIVPLGKWVLKTAAKQYHEWNKLGFTNQISIAVNLSFRQIEKATPETCKEYVDIVKKSCGDEGINNFELELTETTLMKYPEKSKEVLHGLHMGGFKLAIDDFGTGYSSLQYLKYWPIQRIKIDQSFIAGIGTKKEDEIIVDAAITLANKLGLGVIAEGVETKNQFEFLKKHGCKQFQGYYLSYPLSAADMLNILKDNAKK